jgi:hypothetical protein
MRHLNQELQLTQDLKTVFLYLARAEDRFEEACILSDYRRRFRSRTPTPLMRAIDYGITSLIQFLLDDGVDPDAQVKTQGGRHGNALLTAVGGGNEDIVRGYAINGKLWKVKKGYKQQRIACI